MIGVADDHLTALRFAQEAGELLLELRRAHASGLVDAAVIRDAGDRLSHEYLVDALAAAHPGDAVLSEEGKDDLRRTANRRAWIIDPLDGTREYGELDRTDWAVHVALAVDGHPAVGALAIPARSRAFSTWPPSAVVPRAPGRLRILVSRTRPPEIATMVAERLDAELVPMGSAGAKVAAVLLGEADAYLHAGGQWEWDSAAPVAVALAAGLHASGIDGRTLAYNQVRPWQPDLLVCRPGLAAPLLGAIRDAMGATPVLRPRLA